MAFAMVVRRRPVSRQHKRNPKYEEALRQEAARRCPAPQGNASLYARITWFHIPPRSGQDVDNIVKPILDALKGIVYDDDASIGQCLVTAVDASRAYEISSTNIDQAVYDDLIAALAEAEHVLYIEVGSADSTGVVFGPIDGGGR